MDTHISDSSLRALLAAQRAAHAQHTPDYAQRMDDLRRLRSAFKTRFDDLATAMSADFGHRSRHESQLADGMTVLHAIDHARAHLRRWMKPKRMLADWQFWPATCEIRYQPLGVVGVIAPWNYPVNLALIPLVEALAAGNHVMLKPSEHTPRTSAALAELLASVFPQERVATVLGGPEVGATFTTLPFDHLFFTGSTAIGRKVAMAAAPNLTPVTLELGGKSPAIVAPGYPLATAAARIAAGKLLNAGQTCIAPDYVLLPTAAREGFVQALRAYVQQHYPALRDTPDYTSIVSERQYARLKNLVEDARAKGATVVTLPGEDAHDPARRVFAPTLLLDVDDGMAVMQDEIFGPILPLVGYGAIEEALAYVNRHPQPLALYHFDHDRARTERVLDQTLAGGVSVNDAVLHIVQSKLPFGGVGPSGMGHYHGHAGFLTFSKQKPVFRQARFSSLALLRPPYGAFAERMLKFLTR